jgi:hypothetical protein
MIDRAMLRSGPLRVSWLSLSLGNANEESENG